MLHAEIGTAQRFNHAFQVGPLVLGVGAAAEAAAEFDDSVDAVMEGGFQIADPVHRVEELEKQPGLGRGRIRVVMAAGVVGEYADRRGLQGRGVEHRPEVQGG